MERKETNYLKSIAFASLGFGVGGVVGNFALYLLVRSQILRWPLSFIPEDQNFIKLLSAIVLVVLGLGFSTGIGGAIGGFALSRIDPIYSRRKYIWRTAIAVGVAEGVLILPLILLTAIIALYNNGLDRDPTGQVILFGIYGVIFGVLFGLILGLTTVGWRQTWRVLLGSIAGFGLGGAAMGYGLRLAYYPATLGEALPDTAIILPILSLVFFAIGGAFIGLVYEWVAHWRVENVPHEPARWVKIAGVLAAILIAFFLISNYRQLIKFLTIKPASLSSQLAMDTTGVHWLEPEVVSRNLSHIDVSAYSLSANQNGLANAAWVVDNAEATEIVFSTLMEQEGQHQTQWSSSIPASLSPGINSIHPEVTVDNNGIGHLVWTEDTDLASETSDVYYSRCEGDVCSQPVRLTNTNDITCKGNVDTNLTSKNDWPVIANDEANSIMVLWSNSSNALVYSTWNEGQIPPATPSGCLAGPNLSANPLDHLRPRVAGGLMGYFSSIFTAAEPGGETIYTVDYDGENWSELQSIANGTTPDVFADVDGQIYYAWCDDSEKVQVKNPETGLVETVDFPPCNSRPTMAQDEDGFLHLVWFSNKVKNNGNSVSAANIIYESIRTDQGWSDPAIVVQTETSTAPLVAGEGGGDLTILWAENGNSNLKSANQPIYDCSGQDPGRIGQLILDVAQSGEFRPEDDTIPYCGNNYIGMIYMPNPEPAFSPLQPSPNGGFDTVSDIASVVEYEVLFSVMEWARDDDETELNPGSVYTREIAELYQQIKEDPSRYPRGLTVRILLGNYPELSNFEWGEQIWAAIDDLRQAGVDKMVDSEIGWKVEVANFEGVYPHSHTKFLIIDGKIAMAAGFNYGYLHFPFEHPSDKGGDLFDLGIVLSGPIAQQVLVTYDDYWDGAGQVHCPDLSPDPDLLWTRDCVRSVAQATHVPEVQKYFLSGGTSNAYSLNRNMNFLESDEIILSVLSSAEESLDIMEVNFSLELICALDLLNDDVCSYDDALEYMKAIMTAVEQNHTRVRVLVEKVNSNGMENGISAKEFTRELEKRGLDQYVEIKFFEGRMHSKAFLVDDELLVVGSQNFHYSAWDDGLAEYNLATDDPRAIETFKKMFDYYWETGIPWEEYK